MRKDPPGSKRILHILFCAIVFLLTHNNCFSYAESPKPVKRVLLAFADTPEFLSYPPFLESFKKTLFSDTNFKYEMFYEYLAISRNAKNPEYIASLKNLLLTKYKSAHLDLVVLFGGTGTKFMLENGAEVFPGIPKILAGASVAVSQKDIPPNFSILRTSFDALPAVQAILKMQPKVRKIYVVIGNSPGEKSVINLWTKQFEPIREKISIQFLNEMVLPELFELASHLENDSVLLFHAFFQDIQGNTYYPVNVVRRLYQESRVPIYTTQDAFLGLGPVGGMISSSRLQGEGVAKLSHEILTGQELPKIYTFQSTECVYDWRELYRWKLNEATVPANSRIEYREPSVWERYLWQIVVVTGLLVLQCVYIFSLHASRNRRIKVEETLRGSESKFRTLFENSPIGVAYHRVIYNEVGNPIDYYCLDANKHYLELIGEDPRGKMATGSFLDFGEDNSDLIKAFARVAQAGESIRFQQHLALTDRWYDCVAFQSTYDHFVVAFLEITEQKRAEEELKKARNYISNIIDSMPSMLIGVDADGKVTQWNKKVQQVTGIVSEDATGLPLEQIFPRMSTEMERVRNAMRTREIYFDSNRTHYKDDKTHYEDVTVYPLIANGVEGAVIRLDDVTERVRLEEMMVQSEKMLSIGGLAAGMAHEINNPLGGMTQTASVMSDRLTNLKLPANLRAAEEAGITMEAIRAFMEKRKIIEMLDRIRKSGNRAAEIIQNMLSFARKNDSSLSTHNLPELLDRCVDLAGADYDLKKKYDFRQIEIVREYEDGLPGVPCESGKIQQVLLNILRNGAEAMQEARKENETVETRRPCFILRLAYEREVGMVRIEVEDNGPGMEEDVRRRVFEPFFTTKPTDRGTGLGLSVSYFIITENHKGEMTVESTPGKSAKFIIRLPVKRRGP